MLNSCHILLLIAGVFLPIKSEPCFTENMACQLDSFNLLDVFENIPRLSECKEICEDTSECQYYTYYADELIPTHYQNCYLFRLCNTLIDFPKAYTGFTGLCTCSLEVEPQDGKMVEKLYAETEIECKHACQDHTDCEIYAFLEPAFDCELLQDVSSFGLSPIQGFHTGPGNCTSGDGICTFSLLDDNSYTLLVESKESILVRSGMLDCTVNVSMVLMGQGGHGNNGNGGGSGYVNSTFANLYPTTSLDISFESDRDVTIHANGLLLFQTMVGERASAVSGGDGYSGGGYNGYSGGRDGENGNCTSNHPERCGKGQGIDIHQLSTHHFILTPGVNNGNGGGGVLVNENTSFGTGGGWDASPQGGLVTFEIVQ